MRAEVAMTQAKRQQDFPEQLEFVAASGYGAGGTPSADAGIERRPETWSQAL
jgi:hypothetical protein